MIVLILAISSNLFNVGSNTSNVHINYILYVISSEIVIEEVGEVRCRDFFKLPMIKKV